MMTIMMPGNIPNVNNMKHMDSAETCWVAAKQWAESDLSDELKQMGAIGKIAGCAFSKNENKEKGDPKSDDGSF
jgi:hypothetical protein